MEAQFFYNLRFPVTASTIFKLQKEENALRKGTPEGFITQRTVPWKTRCTSVASCISLMCNTRLVARLSPLVQQTSVIPRPASRPENPRKHICATRYIFRYQALALCLSVTCPSVAPCWYSLSPLFPLLVKNKFNSRHVAADVQKIFKQLRLLQTSFWKIVSCKRLVILSLLRDRITRYHPFLKDSFEEIIVLSFTAYSSKICMLCGHLDNRFFVF